MHPRQARSGTAERALGTRARARTPTPTPNPADALGAREQCLQTLALLVGVLAPGDIDVDTQHAQRATILVTLNHAHPG